MKKCKACKKEIDQKANKCPYCQTDQRNWFIRHKLLTVILVLILIGMISTSSSGGSKNTTTIKTTKTETKKQPEQINVTEFVDEFEANQVSAEKKWGGKYIQFSAQITNITDSGLSFANVASKEFSLAQISCRVNNKNQLLPLKKGETITVKGIVGKQTLGVIDISDCEVVK